MTALDAIGKFYENEALGNDGGAEKKIIWFKFGFIYIPMPNLASRSENLYLHDISHVVTGNDVSWKGESSTGSWEIGAGGWMNLWFPMILTIWSMGIGVMFYTKASYRAFQKGKTMYNAGTCGIPLNELLPLSIEELTAKLTRPAGQENKANYFVWAAICIVAWVVPLALIGYGIYSIFA
jgi:hypothetical protein